MQEVLYLWFRRKTLLICNQSSIVGILGITKAIQFPKMVLCLLLLPHFNFISNFLNVKIEKGATLKSVTFATYRNTSLVRMIE